MKGIVLAAGFSLLCLGGCISHQTVPDTPTITVVAPNAVEHQLILYAVAEAFQKNGWYWIRSDRDSFTTAAGKEAGSSKITARVQGRRIHIHSGTVTAEEARILAAHFYGEPIFESSDSKFTAEPLDVVIDALADYLSWIQYLQAVNTALEVLKYSQQVESESQ